MKKESTKSVNICANCFINTVLRSILKIRNIFHQFKPEIIPFIFVLIINNHIFALLKKWLEEFYKLMANHKSALKRIRSNDAKRLRNRYQHKTARTFIKRLRDSEDKAEAEKLLIEVVGMIDKLAKRNIIHANKASNLKSKLTLKVNALA